MARPKAKSVLLRRTMQANGAFSIITGAALVVAFKPLSGLIGVGAPWILAAIGVSLIAFAVGLFQNSRNEYVNERQAMTAIIMDFGWVVGSLVLIASGVLESAGNWTVALVADLVLVFAIVQAVGLRRLRRAPAPT